MKIMDIVRLNKEIKKWIKKDKFILTSLKRMNLSQFKHFYKIELTLVGLEDHKSLRGMLVTQGR